MGILDVFGGRTAEEEEALRREAAATFDNVLWTQYGGIDTMYEPDGTRRDFHAMPKDRYTADMIQAAVDANASRSSIREGIFDKVLGETGDLRSAVLATQAADFTPALGTAIGLQEANIARQEIMPYLQEGDYKSAAIEGINTALGLGDAALTALPIAGGAWKTARRFAPNTSADAVGLGRSLLSGDMEGVRDTFTRSRPPQPLSAFGGERAMGLTPQEDDLLQKAKDMFAAGESNLRVFNETGWFKGADGKLRFEINDQAATVKDMNAQTLGDFLDHPELFRLYPNMQNNPVIAENMSSGSLGSYNPRSMQIRVQRDTPENVKSPLMHEVQHALQDLEGFSRGSTPSGGYSKEQAQRFAQSIMENDSAAKSRQAFYDTQGASAELKPLYTAQYIDKLDALTERALDGRAKPRDITRLGEWYRWGDKIRSELGPMPKKAGRERDYWIASAARQLRDMEIENLDDYARLSYEDTINRFETPKDRANAVKRIERRRDKTAPASREYYNLTKRAKEAQQLDDIEAYLQNAGEVEARNVQTRLDPEKSKLFPWATQDYDYNQQIVDNFSKYDDPSSIYLSMNEKPLGLLVLEQQARGNKKLGGLLSDAGLNISDLSTANPADLEKLLHTAANRGILDARSANNLMRGLLD